MDRLGFAPASAPSFSGARLRTAARCSVSGPRMALSRREAMAGAAGAAAAALLSGVGAVLAKSGDAPKQSIFGVGGASSPFSSGVQRGGEVQYTPFEDDELLVFKRCVDDSKERLAGSVAIIKGKSWDDLRSQIRLEMTGLRTTATRINKNISDKSTAEKASKAFGAFKLAIEDLDYAAVTKNQDKAYKSLTAATKNLDSWSSTVGF